jgi:hypothetical protein
MTNDDIGDMYGGLYTFPSDDEMGELMGIIREHDSDTSDSDSEDDAAASDAILPLEDELTAANVKEGRKKLKKKKKSSPSVTAEGDGSEGGDEAEGSPKEEMKKRNGR